MTPLTSQDPASHLLPAVLDMILAQPLRDDMVQALQDGTMVLDASAVERMSTPCAQVLLATGRAADASGAKLQIVNASDVFLSALVDLGLQTAFKNWVI